MRILLVEKTNNPNVIDVVFQIDNVSREYDLTRAQEKAAFETRYPNIDIAKISVGEVTVFNDVDRTLYVSKALNQNHSSGNALVEYFNTKAA